MEGPLSKWTNLVNGWQYRWFVLDENAGILWYYTSKEKRLRGVHRGCIKLQGAQIGIDDEDDSTFTITTIDQKKFYYFQAKDAEEKENWINILENTIMLHDPKQNLNSHHAQNGSSFDARLAEADAYLKLLIDQVKEFDRRTLTCEDELLASKYDTVKKSVEAVIEAVKQNIVLLQISKHLLKEKYESPVLAALEITWPLHNVSASLSNESQPLSISIDSASLANENVRSLHSTGSTGKISAGSSLHHSAECLVLNTSSSDAHVAAPKLELPLLSHSLTIQSLSSSLPNLMTPTEEFRDVPSTPVGSPLLSQTSGESALQRGIRDDHSDCSSENEDFFDAEENMREANSSVPEQRTPLVISPKNDYYDELYDDVNEDQLESMESHGSIVSHVLSQLRIGMDLTKVALPTFILEKRSLLEMYADFFAHPDLFVNITAQKTPRERLIQSVRWYLSAFHAGRKSSVAKKPYNPILGEVFQCYYDLPDDSSEQELATDGPVPWTTKNNLAFIAEQVSHHPPISAFYGECQEKRISLDGYIWTKSKFLGLSIGVHNIGQAVISVLDYEEDYTITFPNAYGRSILTVPWLELGGTVNVTCSKTGYYAQIEFHTKPFYGGKKDLITAELFGPDKKSFCTIKGEWNGIMWARYLQAATQNEIFVDTINLPIIKKQVKPIEQQREFESRRLWRNVTYNLKNRNVEAASEEKRALEQRQRDELKERTEAQVKWDTRCFHEVGAHWVYDKPLVKRLATRHGTKTVGT